MQYTLKRIVDACPQIMEELKQRCYPINGCLAKVHNDLGPFLNEYMYQDALQILLDMKQIPYQREYLWNYMRLTGKQLGILYNFGPVKGQSEHYYLGSDGTMYMF